MHRGQELQVKLLNSVLLFKVSRSPEELSGTALSRFELNGPVGTIPMDHRQPLATTLSPSSFLGETLSRLRGVHWANH